MMVIVVVVVVVMAIFDDSDDDEEYGCIKIAFADHIVGKCDLQFTFVCIPVRRLSVCLDAYLSVCLSPSLHLRVVAVVGQDQADQFVHF